MLSMINVCFKTTNILIQRGKIDSLLNILLKDPFKPRDREEIEIIEKFRKVSRFVIYISEKNGFNFALTIISKHFECLLTAHTII